MTLIADSAAIANWLQTPNPDLRHLKPLELIERGEIDRLGKMIHYLF